MDYVRLVSFLTLAAALSLHFSIPSAILIPLWVLLVLAYALAVGERKRLIVLLPFIVVPAIAFLFPLPLPDAWTPVQKLVTVTSVWTLVLTITTIICIKSLSQVERAAQRGELTSLAKPGGPRSPQ